MFDKIAQFTRDVNDATRFLMPENKVSRKLVFYSEGAGYFRYFEGLYNYLIEHSNVEFSYVSSDFRDPILTRSDRVQKYYINHSLATTFSRLDSDLVVLTIPDLGKSYLKRPASKTEFVYVFHALVSTHLQYNLGAFDNYDTMLLVGPHHEREIRESESLYGTRAKHLVEAGYYLTEKLYAEAGDFEKSAPGSVSSEQKKVLIAPSWSKGGIFESCLDDLLATLLSAGSTCVLRPHPEFVKRYPDRMKGLNALCQRDARLTIETNHLLSTSLHDSDLLITDRSGICFEYAFARERPVLFIDTPLKVHNPEYERISVVPVEISSREKMGVSVSPERIKQDLINHIDELESRRVEFQQNIVALRESMQFNWMNSSKVTAQYILSKLV
ncbi:MAG: CDP-glycerol glycerophosphotransferase family protein [Candidatus Obscuribacterales bacterium]|nr:CDP-glycerol glycerophosphotransferase family protein [Candidatus Obscuribacterales bacterium]